MVTYGLGSKSGQPFTRLADLEKLPIHGAHLWVHLRIPWLLVLLSVKCGWCCFAEELNEVICVCEFSLMVTRKIDSFLSLHCCTLTYSLISPSQSFHEAFSHFLLLLTIRTVLFSAIKMFSLVYTKNLHKQSKEWDELF